MKWAALNPRLLSSVLAGAFALFGPLTAYAANGNLAPSVLTTETASICEAELNDRPRTLSELTALAQDHQAALRIQYPSKTYSDYEADSKLIFPTNVGPKALAGMNPLGVFFPALQSDQADLPSVVKLEEPFESTALVFETEVNGKKYLSYGYASLPLTPEMAPEDLDKNGHLKYLFGREYRKTAVIVWDHGGGTSSGSGSNGMTIAKFAAHYGVGVWGMDMSGHSFGPTDEMTSEEKARFVMNAVRRYIDPQVPLIYIGHSWGAQQTVWMWLNAHRDEFNRFVGHYALNPPADPTFGGTYAEKMKAREQWQSCFEENALRAAPKDVKFLINIHRNGKSSPVSGLSCSLTSMDYNWIAPKDDFERPPMAILQGEGDLLTYVGHEDSFKKFVSQLTGVDLVILGHGRSYNSPWEQTGHGVFDRYLGDDEKAQFADFLGSDVDKKDIYDVYTRLMAYTEQRVGHKLAPLNESRKQSFGLTLMKYYKHYGANLAFQKYVDHAVEYVRIDTPKVIEDSKTIGLLKGLLSKKEAVDRKIENEAAEELRKKIKALSAEYDVANPSTAQRELDLRVSADRRKELETFIDHAEKLSEEFRTKYPSLEEKISGIPVPAGVHDLKSAEEEKAVTKDPARRKALQKYVEDVRAAMKAHAAEFGEALNRQLHKSLSFPEGVRTIGDARWEAGLQDSPERRAHLQEYLTKVKDIEAESASAKGSLLAKRSAEIKLPGGFSSFEQARQTMEELSARRDGTYVPEGANRPAVEGILTRQAQLKTRLDELSSEIKKTVDDVNEAKAAVRAWKDAAETALQNMRPSPKLEHVREQTEASYKAYAASETDLTQFMNAGLVQMEKEGDLSLERRQALKRSARSYVADYQQARKEYFAWVSAADQVISEEALAGQLGTRLQSLYKEYYGVSGGRPGLLDQLKIKMDLRDQLLSQRAALAEESEELKAKYSVLTNSPVQYRAVPLKDVFNRPLPELLNELNDGEQGSVLKKALQQGLKTFEDMWKAHDEPQMAAEAN